MAPRCWMTVLGLQLSFSYGLGLAKLGLFLLRHVV
jgi:hypothetical protein